MDYKEITELVDQLLEKDEELDFTADGEGVYFTFKQLYGFAADLLRVQTNELIKKLYHLIRGL